MSIKIVPQFQPDEQGCLTTCLAMIRGIPYDTVAKDFHDLEHMTMIKAANYLADYGYTVMIKEMLCWNNPRAGFQILTEPFADAHIIQVFHYTDYDIAHALVMNADGDIFNPDQDHDNNLERCFRVPCILGIWN